MQSLVLNNFKSYHELSLRDLNSRINVVLGSNGQGKSNLLKAIAFLFTNKFVLNKAEYGSTLNREAVREGGAISVESSFRHGSTEEPYHLSRSWQDSAKEVFSVNDKNVSEKQFSTLIESLGLSRSNAFNFFHQGKISEIASMSEVELYSLLEDCSSSKKVAKSEGEALGNVERIGQNVKEVATVIEELDSKMADLERKKVHFQQFSMQQKVTKYHKKLHYEAELEKTKEELKEMNTKYEKVLAELQQREMKRKELDWQFSEVENDLRISRKQFEDVKALLGDSGSASGEQSAKDAKLDKKTASELRREVESKKKKIQVLEKSQAEIGKKLEYQREKFQQIKNEVEFVSGQNVEKQKAEKCLQAKILSEQKAQKAYAEELREVEHLMMDLDSKRKSNLDSLGQYQAVEREKNLQTDQLNKTKRTLIELRASKINTEGSLLRSQEKIKQLEALMRKAMPLIDFSLIQRAKQSGIRGVHGYLLSHLEIEEQLQFAYEKAGLGKLCSILVEDEEAAVNLIKFNSQSKGRTITVVPLSIVEKEPNFSIPRGMADVHSLANPDWISLKEESQRTLGSKSKSKIQWLISNTFRKYVVVPSYEKALKVSKELHVNCITSDKQVVYSDAFLCKVGGQTEFQRSRLQLFRQMQEAALEFEKNSEGLKEKEKQILEIENQLIEQSNRVHRVTKTFEILHQRKEESDRIAGLLTKLSAKESKLSAEKSISQKSVAHLSETLSRLQKGKASKRYSEKDLEAAERDYTQQQREYEKCESELHNSIFGLNEASEKLKALEKVNSDSSESGRGREGSSADSLPRILEKLTKQMDQLQLKYEGTQNAIMQTNEQLQKIKREQSYLLAELSVEQDKKEDLRQNLEALRAIGESLEEAEELEEMSRTLSRRISQRKNYIFTSRDKMFFIKLEEFISKKQKLAENETQIQRVLTELSNLTQRLKQERGQAMKTLVSEFEKSLVYYFGRMVTGGRIEVVLKNLVGKVKGVSKTGHSLRIKASFSGEGVQDWKEFSLGQRSVLSVCMVMAIQHCEPVPFCIMDEADAALDSEYARRLVNLVCEKSSDCQYWLSSFKQETIQEIPDTLANFYLVTSQNQRSSVSKITKAEAHRFCNSVR